MMKAIHENIKELRKEKGMTQTDLAKAVGYTDRSMITKIEQGSVILSQDRIEAFAKALDTTPEALTGWSPDRCVSSVEYHADAIASILGYMIGGDPAEGVITIEHEGNEHEITDRSLELYQIGLVQYAKFLLDDIIAKSRKETPI